ncbi:hybrid sensor histidine kinase/response regulator [Paracoccus rhizosphaerae]|uniref:histidine kinase n=1 Tax=Paracoccus rhizosphaerae TaxID=1133347 RepID=A0ABV6CH96_9RHOB|nr:response regulator [Paracoccus rhizosphaerae]
MTRNLDLPIIGIIIAAFGGIFALDMMFPLGTAVWLLYLLPLTLASATRLPSAPIVVALLACVAMAAGFMLDRSGIDPQVAAFNRSMAGLVYVALGVTGRRLILNRLQLTRTQWVNQAQIDVSRGMQGDLSPERLAKQVLTILGDRLGARAAVVYARNGSGHRLLSSWGVDDAALPARLPEGQGHLGRCISEGRALQLTLSPDEALGWTSGLSRGRSAHAVIVPLRDGQLVNGAVELGLDHPAPGRVMELLEGVGDRMGVALRSAQYREQLQELLEETRRQAEELRGHGEELAASNEELEEQTRQLQDSQRRLEAQQAELETQNSQLESQTQEMEEQRDALARSRRMLEDQAQELARESRYKSEFVANMSHELRTPLNALLIMARLLSENRGRNLTEEQVRWAETIESSGQDLLALINDILDLSKIESGKLEVSNDLIDPQAVAEKLVRAFEVQARSKGLQLVAEVAPGLGQVETDSQRLEQVLRNFISNALKFTERGRVTLRIAPAAQGVAFSVEDTGIGIDADQQENVFEAFRQADGTISRRFGGTGLGLSISRELADLLGGRITLTSEKGRGSVFTLILPATPARQRPAAQRQQVAAPLPEAQDVDVVVLDALPGLDDDHADITADDRVMLVVEDDVEFARLLYDLAHELGFRCVCVGRADDAVRAARHFLPQAIVLDMGLPDHSGLSALDRLKRDTSTRHIPVHVVSAEDYTKEALAQGAISYMLKPVQRDHLANAIRKLETRLEQRLRRVLIVEDDPAQMEGLKALLASDEVVTVGAGTAARALEICRTETVDCIVLDMTLPDASGFELLEQLSGDGTASFPPVIVYTARALSEAEEQRLRRYSKSIIIKGAKSPERLINEVTLFLHQVVSDLPEKQREMLAASLNRDGQLEGRRILVVEDDIRNVYALTGVFEPHGATVQIARNGREALEALGRVNDGAAPKIDLVLMDVMMPEMDGLTATREIRKLDRWKTLPIIMLTAKAMAEDQNQCLAAGANDYLPKPLDVDKLLSLTRVWMPR